MAVGLLLTLYAIRKSQAQRGGSQKAFKRVEHGQTKRHLAAYKTNPANEGDGVTAYRPA